MYTYVTTRWCNSRPFPRTEIRVSVSKAQWNQAAAPSAYLIVTAFEIRRRISIVIVVRERKGRATPVAFLLLTALLYADIIREMRSSSRGFPRGFARLRARINTERINRINLFSVISNTDRPFGWHIVYETTRYTLSPFTCLIITQLNLTCLCI